MLIVFFRAIILYLALILAIRLMGKRQVGQMEPAEFVVTMLIADLASVPMQDQAIPLFSGLIPIFIVLAIELILSVLIYHSIPFRRFFCGKPVILIQNGKLLSQNMQKTRINADELTEQLRLQGVVDITTVQYAILETNGSVSVLPYPKHAPASAKDAGVQASPLALPVTVVSHGQLLHDNLQAIGKTRSWVEQTLANYNCRIPDVLLLTCDKTGRLYLAMQKEAQP